MTLPRLRTILISALFIAVIGYTGIEARALIEGPTISVDSIRDGAVLDSSLIKISGTSSHIASMTLNGRTILTDTEGNFSEELLLPLGYTILSIHAADRFGRTKQTYLHLFRNS